MAATIGVDNEFNDSDRPCPHWNIWKTADKLEKAANTAEDSFYPDITRTVVSILREWGYQWAGEHAWMSLLNKGTLLHEVEESIVAIHYLIEGTATAAACDNQKIVILDVCAGKGLFSFLLSYMRQPNIAQIIMLEKATINWHHIEEANKTAEEEHRPMITIWSNTDLHNYDAVLDRIVALPHSRVALSGIHLCKQLGPSFCGLVNGLGRKCIYACLSPCCMPRAVTAQKYFLNQQSNHESNENENNKSKQKKKHKTFTLSIQLEESSLKRQERRDYMERRARLKRKPFGGPCFHCHAIHHGLRECPVLPILSKEEQTHITQEWHKATMPCWNCLEYGHYKVDCPKAQLYCSTSHKPRPPPTLTLDVSSVLQSTRPYATYCQLLATGFEGSSSFIDTNEERCNDESQLDKKTASVIETPLQNVENHQEGNWNSGRKSIFIVVK
jgi:hypothetical protein